MSSRPQNSSLVLSVGNRELWIVPDQKNSAVRMWRIADRKVAFPFALFLDGLCLHSEAKGSSPRAIPYLPVLLRSKTLAILGPPREWMVD